MSPTTRSPPSPSSDPRHTVLFVDMQAQHNPSMTSGDRIVILKPDNTEATRFKPPKTAADVILGVPGAWTAVVSLAEPATSLVGGDELQAGIYKLVPSGTNVLTHPSHLSVPSSANTSALIFSCDFAASRWSNHFRTFHCPRRLIYLDRSSSLFISLY